MLRTGLEGRNDVGPGRRRLIATLVTLVAGALVLPSFSLAGSSSGGGSATQGPCTAEVTATQDPTVASFSVDCSEGSDNIVFARLETTESGSVEGNTGTTCTEIDSTTFDCEPTDPGQLVTGRFTNAREDEVCADPRLAVDFTLELGGDDEGASNAEALIEDVEVANCDDSAGTSGGGASGDEESVPEGGVDSGRGPVEPAASSALPLAVPILAVLGLAGGGLLIRRRRMSG